MSSNQSWHDQVEAQQKQLETLAQRAVDRVRAAVASRTPGITSSFFYGAIGIDPKHLTVWYVFGKDAQKKEATRNGLSEELDARTREALREEGYPPLVLAIIHIGFASDQEINRAGGWRQFFA